MTDSRTRALHTAFQEGAERVEGGGAVLGGPLSGVDPVMQSEGRAPGEGLAALCALIRLFSGVNSPMQDKVRVSVESFSAFATFIGFLPRVDPLMFCQV